jgi:hypothetical protein
MSTPADRLAVSNRVVLPNLARSRTSLGARLLVFPELVNPASPTGMFSRQCVDQREKPQRTGAGASMACAIRSLGSERESVTMPKLTRRDLIEKGSWIMGAAAGTTLFGPAAIGAQRALLKSFTPGELWLDTAGKPIQAHGGSMIVVDGVFYWYGENKEFTTATSAIRSWGVRFYRSTDLYNWEDLGPLIKPDETDSRSPLYPKAQLDRPHIIYNPKTRKFVCWIKMLSEAKQTRAVLIADAITGPYRLVSQDIQPLGMSAGDFDIVASADDGKAYMYFERVHSELICADLDADYSAFAGYYSTHFPLPGPPSVREGLAYFRRGTTHYLVSSGTTGYFPNPSEITAADTYHGPWTRLGDLHPEDQSRTSFNSQISCVFKHPGKKDLYIAMADRWMGSMSGAPFESGATSALVQSAFAKRFASPPLPMTPEEQHAMDTKGGLDVNTSQARYVWLPLQFDAQGKATIAWRREWSLDEYA